MAFERVYRKNDERDIVYLARVGDSIEGVLVDLSWIDVEPEKEEGLYDTSWMHKEKEVEDKMLVATFSKAQTTYGIGSRIVIKGPLKEYPWKSLIGKYIKIEFRGWDTHYWGDTSQYWRDILQGKEPPLPKTIYPVYEVFVDYDRKEGKEKE